MSTWRAFATCALGVLLTVSLAPTGALAQSEAVALQWNVAPGEAMYYTLSNTFQITNAGDRQPTLGQYTGRQVIRVLEVEGGKTLVEMVNEDLKLLQNGQTQSVAPVPYAYRVGSDGRVAATVTGTEAGSAGARHRAPSSSPTA